MSKLEYNITDLEYCKEKFSSWEVSEQIIDDKKAFYMICKPDSEYQKVCLYRDGCNMFIYGDYGQYTFDSMTWLGTPYNLEYNNLGYQLEKMERNCRKSLYEFDDKKCEEDLKEWFKEKIEYNYEDSYKEISDNLFKQINSNIYFDFCEFCENNYECYELQDLIEFIQECYENIDEYKWIPFLQDSNLDKFEEKYESWLWKAGKVIRQEFYVALYALKICGEKLGEK